ncbi:MAG: methyltransferase domain-containing protein [Bryobacteraceae bacterium]
MNPSTTSTAYNPCDEKRSWRDQFACPTGWMGKVAGFLMSFRSAERSQWVMSQLDLEPKHRVLEIGFGSGTDIKRALEEASFVAGVDHSSTMLEQASSRNRDAIVAKKADLKLGSADALPFGDAEFDRVFAINVAQFWPDRVRVMHEVRRVTKPGGMVCVAVQPRSKGATDQAAGQMGTTLASAFRDAGFEDIRVQTKSMKPVATVCVSARRG